MNEIWYEELSKYTSMMQSQKIVWLSKLIFFISMFARDTYQIGTVQVDKPEELRLYNELVHRISSFLLELETEEPGCIPEDQFFSMLFDAIEELNLDVSTVIDEIRKH